MASDFEQEPFIDVEFFDNPESRCPCLLLLDVSASMSGNPISQLNQGIQSFEKELKADSLASKRVDVAIVTFGPVRQVTDFAAAQHFSAPYLEAEGSTPMGAAIEEGLRILRNRKQQYRDAGITPYRPWVFSHHGWRTHGRHCQSGRTRSSGRKQEGVHVLLHRH
jgi:hypothetical protein